MSAAADRLRAANRARGMIVESDIEDKALKITEDVLNKLEAIRGKTGVLEGNIDTVWNIYGWAYDRVYRDAYQEIRYASLPMRRRRRRTTTATATSKKKPSKK